MHEHVRPKADLFAVLCSPLPEPENMAYVNAVFSAFGFALRLAAPHAKLPRFVSANIKVFALKIWQKLGVERIHKVERIYVRIECRGIFADSAERIHKRRLALRKMRVFRIPKPPFHVSEPVHVRDELYTRACAYFAELAHSRRRQRGRVCPYELVPLKRESVLRIKFEPVVFK